MLHVSEALDKLWVRLQLNQFHHLGDCGIKNLKRDVGLAANHFLDAFPHSPIESHHAFPRIRNELSHNVLCELLTSCHITSTAKLLHHDAKTHVLFREDGFAKVRQ